jgi:deoxyinosine 3'endonuclease (endonuclease V)
VKPQRREGRRKSLTAGTSSDCGLEYITQMHSRPKSGPDTTQELAPPWPLPAVPSGPVGANRAARLRAPPPYRPGFLALREGPLLAEAVCSLTRLPDVLLVDATGEDHPRKAGLALHLGAILDLPTVGVTHRPLLATGEAPALERGAMSPLSIDESVVAYWVCTRSSARPVVAHGGWRTSPTMAAAVVLACSSEAARTPIPLVEARRVARQARAVAEGRVHSG